MSDVLSPGRRILLESIDTPEIVADVAADEDLSSVGLSSGDLIRLALAIEDHTGAPLYDDELPMLQTISGIDRILAARDGTAGHRGTEQR